ncbi:UvrD/REP helicase [Enterococcus faecalis 13-SD-W-01]|nr:UvrD/REP helicase [Enterococcus faecalis 13-SD-W-01]
MLLLRKPKHRENIQKDGSTINQLEETKIRQLEKEVKSWKQKYQKLQQIFRLQEEIIASYEAAYGEAPGLIDETKEEKGTSDQLFFDHMEKRSYNRFNQEQREAIIYDMEKNLRIIAGAGSGKTQTICAKAVYLMKEKQVAEQRILMITFTRNAANELKKRVDNFSQRKTDVHIGTFHSIFFRLYKEISHHFPESVRSIGDFGKESSQRLSGYLQQLIRKYNLFVFDQFGEKTIASRLDYWQNMDLSHEEIVELVREKFDSIEKNAAQPISQRLHLLLDELEQIKESERLTDFNDVLKNLKNALEIKEIQQFIGEKYDYLFIDEFQDTNPLQWEIVKRLVKDTKIKLIVVGDDDQSIYSFRGSEPAYIKNFDQEFPTETLFLLTNYRSRASIVQSANRLIKHNKNERIEKSMVPAQAEKGITEALYFPDTQAESRWIIQQVRSFLRKKGKYKETIILYRSFSQTQQLIQQLLTTDIPFVVEADTTYEGVFGLKVFRIFYERWSAWLKADTEKKKRDAYRQLLRTFFANCYLKKKDIDQFFYGKQTENPATYISKKNPALKDKENLLNGMLKELEKSDHPGYKIKPLFQYFIQLPRVTKELDKSESGWLMEEIEKHPTFHKLQKMEKQIQSEAKQLKTRLIAYHQGKLDALCIQSIHKSKGLSYRNVFLIGCNEGNIPHNGVMERAAVPAETIKSEPVTTIEEERRLFYVAMTRARNRLYLCVPQTKGSRSLKPSRFIREAGIYPRKITE